MIITHSLEEKDYIQFNLFQIEHSEKLKKRLHIQRIVVSVVFVGLALLAYSLLNRLQLTVSALFLVGSLLWYAYFPTFSKNQVIRATKKTIGRGQLANLFDEVRLEFDHEGIKEVTSQGEYSQRWEELQSIYQTPDYLYFFLENASAVIVPKRTLTDAALSEIDNLIDTHYQGPVERLAKS